MSSQTIPPIVDAISLWGNSREDTNPPYTSKKSGSIVQPAPSVLEFSQLLQMESLQDKSWTSIRSSQYSGWMNKSGGAFIGTRCLSCFMFDGPCNMAEVEGTTCCMACTHYIKPHVGPHQVRTIYYVLCSNHIDLAFLLHSEMHETADEFAKEIWWKAHNDDMDRGRFILTDEEYQDRAATLDKILADEYRRLIKGVLEEIIGEIGDGECKACTEHDKLPEALRGF